MLQAVERCEVRERSDEELFADYRGGDDAAFERIYERRYAELTAFLRRRLPLGAQHDAEDLAETALYKAAAQAQGFDPERGAFRPWLYAIATNLRRDLLRSWTRRLEKLWHANAEDCSEAVDPRDSAEERLLREERLTRALAALTERQRDVVLLTCWEGFSYAETAKILGMQPGTVGAHRDKALKRLRRFLEEDGLIVVARQPAARGAEW
jgi:RNA polymerase sigma-70 factor (ECF subfamily)